MAIQITKRPYAFSFSGNPVLYELYSVLAVSDDSIYFEVKVRFRTVGGDYLDVVTLPYAPTGGTAKVDIKDILHSQLQCGLPTFGEDATAAYEALGQSGTYYIEYREITAANPNPSWDASEAEWERYVVWGGINYFKHRANNFWVNYHAVEKPFLTWQQSGRMAATSERMYLAWLCDGNYSNLSVMVKAYKTDGSAAETKQGELYATYGRVYYIPAGAAQWGLNSGGTYELWYWTVQVVNYVSGSPVAVSAEVTYEADNRQDYNDLTLHYRNSLGGLDSVRVRGVVEKTINYSFTEQARTTDPDYYNAHFIAAQKEVVDVRERRAYKGDIGYLDREEQDRLRDAQLTREVWMEVEGKWIPVNITTASFNQESSLSTRWSMPIEFELAYEGGRFYTPDSVALGDAVFESNVCLAYVTGLTLSADFSGAEVACTVGMNEYDPQSESSAIRWRVILDVDGSTVLDWTQAAYGPLAFSLPKEGEYTLEIQSICTNNVYGIKSTLPINTNTTAGEPDIEPGGGGGGGVVSGNSYLVNNTGISSPFTIEVNGARVADGAVGAHNQYQFNVSFVSGAEVVVILPKISPAQAVLEVGGELYEGVISINEVIFQNVEINAGMTINIY